MQHIFADSGPALWMQPWIIDVFNVDLVEIDDVPLTDLRQVQEVVASQQQQQQQQQQQEAYRRYEMLHGGAGRHKISTFGPDDA